MDKPCHEETLNFYSLSKGLEIRIADNQENLCKMFKSKKLM